MTRWETAWGQHLLNHNETLKSFAKKTGCSEEYIRRHLDFLYSLPSDRLITHLAELTNIPPYQLEAQYKSGRTAQRQLGHSILHDTFMVLTPTTPVAHKHFRYVAASSLLLYCKLICVNPILVERYEIKGGPPPQWLRDAFFETCPHFELEGFFEWASELFLGLRQFWMTPVTRNSRQVQWRTFLLSSLQCTERIPATVGSVFQMLLQCNKPAHNTLWPLLGEY